MNLTTVARVTSAAAVAGVAGIASYAHMRQLASEHGQGELLANLMPVSVDGMLIVASAVMADDRAAGRPVRLSARISFVAGVAASIVANVLAAPDSTVARVISAWPAVALLLVVEMLTGGRSSVAQVTTQDPDTATVAQATAAEPAATPTWDDAGLTDADLAALADLYTTPTMIEPAGVGTPVVEFVPPPADMIEPASGPDVDPREAARDAYRESVVDGTPLSGAALARRFGMSARWGVDRVAEVRKVNGTPATAP